MYLLYLHYDLGQNIFYKETELQCKNKYKVYVTSILLSFNIYFQNYAEYFMALKILQQTHVDKISR